MARTLIPQKVDVIYVRNSGETLILYLDRNSMDFFCNVHGTEYRNKNFDMLRSKIKELANHLVLLTWIPVIEVETPSLKEISFSYEDTPDDKWGEIRLKISRYYISTPDPHRWIQANWNTEPEERSHTYRNFWWENANPGLVASLPTHDEKKSKHYLAYNEETWVGLQRMVAQINILREQLTMFLSDNTNLPKIANVGAQILAGLLESGEKKE